MKDYDAEWWQLIPPSDELAYMKAMQEQRTLMKVWVRRWLQRTRLDWCRRGGLT